MPHRRSVYAFTFAALSLIACGASPSETTSTVTGAQQTTCAISGPSAGNTTRAPGTIHVSETPTATVAEGDLLAGRSRVPAGVYLVTGWFQPFGVSTPFVHSWIGGIDATGKLVAQTALNGSDAAHSYVGPQFDSRNFQKNASTYAWTFYAVSGLSVAQLTSDIPALEAAWRANEIDYSPLPSMPVDKPRANCNTYSQYVLLAEGALGAPLASLRPGAEVVARTPQNGVRHLGLVALKLPCFGAPASVSPAAAACVSAGFGANDVCGSARTPPTDGQLHGNANYTYRVGSARCGDYEVGGESLWTCRKDDTSALYKCLGDVEYRFDCAGR